MYVIKQKRIKMKTQIENEFENDYIDDKTIFNTILLPTIFYATGWSFVAVASMIFFTIVYFLIPTWYKDDEELVYKFRSFLFIFIIIYIPTFTGLFLKFF
jgi:hypothetical protein